jgi:hypothetical protein
VSGVTNAYEFAVDATNFYWTTITCPGDGGPCMGSVQQCAKANCPGSTTVLVSGTGEPSGLVVDATNVYWTVIIGSLWGDVVECKIGGCGGAPTVLASRQSATNLAVDSTSAYWIEDCGALCPDGGTGDGIVQKCATAGCGGTPTTLASSHGASSVVVDSTNVYWMETASGVRECSVSGCGGMPATFAPGYSVANHTAIAAGAGGVYWANAGGCGSPYGGVLWCPAAGCGAVPVVVAGGEIDPTAIVTDSSNVYWAYGGCCGAGTGAYECTDGGAFVMKCPAQGCGDSPLALVRNPSAQRLAVDATRLYWYGGASAVYSVAK